MNNTEMIEHISDLECSVIKNQITIEKALDNLLLMLNNVPLRNVKNLLKLQLESFGIHKVENNTKWNTILLNSGNENISKINPNVWYDYVIDFEDSPNGMLVNPVSTINFVAVCETLKKTLYYASNHNQKALKEINAKINDTKDYVSKMKKAL